MIEQGLWSLDNVMSMMEVLVDTTKPTSVRQMAGILFKRAISSLVNLFYLSG